MDLKRLKRFIPQLPITLKLLAVLFSTYAGWLNFALRSKEVPRFALTFKDLDWELSVPQQCANTFFFAVFLFIASQVATAMIRRFYRDEKTYVLNQQGATWRIKTLVKEGKEHEAIRFVQKNYRMSREEAAMLVKKIRFGIDTTQAALDNSEIDPEDEKTNTNIQALSEAKKKKIVIDPTVAQEAMKLLRDGRDEDALHLVRQENSLDLPTAKRVVEKLKKIA